MGKNTRGQYNKRFSGRPTRMGAEISTSPEHTQQPSVPSEPAKSNGLTIHITTSAAVVSLMVLLAIAAFAAINGHNHPKPATTAPQTAQKTQTPKWRAPVKTGAAPTPAAVSKQIKTTPYYPTNLPTTFRSNNDTQLIGTSTVYYSYSDNKGNQYYVTQQPTPANFNYAAFKSGLSNTEEFSVSIGSAVIGTNASELVGGIRTNNNLWILVGASSANVRTQLKTLINSLQPLTT